MEEKFLSAKRDNEDSLFSLKDDIRSKEALALKKKKELDGVSGDSRRVVVGEIERVFRELDRLRGRENVVAANLDRIDIALAKVGEAKAALRAGVSEEQFDDIALEVQDLFSSLKALDRAAVDLDREKYEPPTTSTVDVEQRVAEIQSNEVAPTGLSAETEKRLKELETEE